MKLYSIKVKKNLLVFRLSKVWNRIYQANDSVKPTQHYDYYRYLFLAFYARRLFSRWKVVFFHVSDGRNECIVPLVVNDKRRLIRGLSNFGRLDYEDVISSTNDPSFVEKGIMKVLENYGEYEIHWVNVNEDSNLYGAFGSRMSFLERCVSIDLPSNYDDYLARLSKHQRQNIRTAYNKTAKESFGFRLAWYNNGNRIPRLLWKQCQMIYEQRHNETGSGLRKWMERQRNPYTHILHTVDDWQVFVLFHGDVPMAYMAGVLSERQGCYYVPRLCINVDFYRYSPGIILLVETIKLLIGENVHCLDLMLGEEPYKTAMGGETHNNYEMKCSVNELFDECTLH